MMAQIIDRKRLKADMKDLLAEAQVSPRGMTALYLFIILLLNLADTFAGGGAPTVPERNLLGIFVYVLVSLLGSVLGAGFVLYCMAVRRGERAEYLTLFDGFSFVGKIIGLQIVINCFVFLWSMLFAIPGIIAAYRYRFALYNLYENPGIGIMEALDMSKRQTLGYKSQLFMLDLSYFGWGLLASAPSLAYMCYVYYHLFDSMFYNVTFTPAFPGWLLVLVGGVWSLAVALFYMPAYQCTELGYFEIAKETSGVGLGVPGDRGPDGLGGTDGWNGGF